MKSRFSFLNSFFFMGCLHEAFAIQVPGKSFYRNDKVLEVLRSVVVL